jgi:hypothetical protein
MYLAQLQANQLSEKGVKDLLKQTLSIKTIFTTVKGGIYSALGAVTGKGKSFDDMFQSGVDFLKMIPGIGGALAGVVGGMKALFDFVVEIEDRTVKFGRNLGYSREQSFEIRNNFASIATGSGKLLLTTENMMEVQTDLSQQLGVNNILTGEMLDTQIELKKVMGLSTDEMGSLAQASIISGKKQKEVVTGILGQVAGLKQATGISFNYKQIIGEVSKLSGVLGLQFAKYPEKLTKSLLITKALGMDLGKIDQIAGGLLDFETAIQNQLEAQLITGKDINLSTAQQLALQGDTAGVAIELAAQMEKVQQGTLALIGSVAGDRGRKSNYVYGAAKGLVTRYAQGLQHRFAKTLIKIVLIKPGPTATAMTAHLPQRGLAAADTVAATIVQGIAQGKAVIYAPAKWAVIMMIIIHLPAFIFNKLDI